MAVFTPDATLDLALDAMIGDVCTRVDVCSTQPTTYAEATATYSLADVTVTSGDFTKANGDTSGRKITLGAQSAVTIDTAGTALHIAFTNGTDTLLHVTTCPSTALTTPGTVDISGVDVLELPDTVAV